MNRYFIYLAYKGTHYCGWQRQPNGISIQQRIEDALSIILRKEILIVGAGRTDAGVHAQKMVAHFDFGGPIFLPNLLKDKLNRLLPKDIAIHNIYQVKDGAHARFDAIARTYKYYISDTKDPFNYEYVNYVSFKGLDFELMNQGCQILYEYKDFTSFSKLHTDVKTNLCRIDFAGWKQEHEYWVFTIRADRFLRNMVRAIVGTLLEVGKGKRSIDDFRTLIELKDRCMAGSSVPGKGLSLVDIKYPETIFLSGLNK